MEFKPHTQENYSYNDFADAENPRQSYRNSFDDSGINTFISQVFLWMFAALMVTAGTSFAILQSEELLSAVVSSFWVLAILELIAVFVLSAAVQSLNPVIATAIFFGYSILNGATLTPLLFQYSPASVITTFGITSVTFGIMAVWGLTTKKDLTSWGNLLFMGLIGLIVMSIFNIFFFSPGFHLVISALGVFIFVGLVAFDTQMLKNLYMNASIEGRSLHGLAILGALSLYLDFINIFIYLLRFFGNSRD